MLTIFFQLVRFTGIGFLNTAVDFAALNLMTSSFGIYTGLGIGALNAVSFGVAVLHSYFWNKYWAFGNQHKEEHFLKSVGQFVAASFLGFVVIASVVVGSGKNLRFGFYFLMLVILLVGEFVLWRVFRLQKDPLATKSGRELLLFVVISLIGVVLNSAIMSGGTSFFPPQFGLNVALWANLWKAVATGISLVWNFLGYKLIVFKR